LQGTLDRDSQRRQRRSLEIQQVDSSQAPSSEITTELRPNGKLVITSYPPAPYPAAPTATSSGYNTGRSKLSSSISKASDYFNYYSLSTIRNNASRNDYDSIDTTVFGDPSSINGNMSSQPLLQTAPGKISRPQLPTPLLTAPRQADRSPNSSRA